MRKSTPAILLALGLTLVTVMSCRTGETESQPTQTRRPVLSRITLEADKVKRVTIGYGKELYVIEEPQLMANIYDTVNHGGSFSTTMAEDGILSFTTLDGRVAVLGFVYPELTWPDNPKFKPMIEFQSTLKGIRAGHVYDKVARIPEFQTKSARILQAGSMKTVRKSQLQTVQDTARKLAATWSPDSAIGCRPDDGSYLRSPDVDSAIILDLAHPIAFQTFLHTSLDDDPAPAGATWAGAYKKLTCDRLAIMKTDWGIEIGFHSSAQGKWYVTYVLGKFSPIEEWPDEKLTQLYDRMAADAGG